MFEPLDHLLKKKERIDSGVLFATRVCFEAGEIIKKLLPEDKSRFKIVSFRDGRLKIAVADSIMAQQIKMKEEGIKKRLQKKAKIKSFAITYSPQG